MREIVTSLFCDQHHSLGERVPATVTRTIGIDTPIPRELDLCAECDEQLMAPMEKLIAAYGRMTEAHVVSPLRRSRTSQAEPTTCPICNDNKKYYNKKVAVDHVWRVHVGKDRPAQPTICPDCNTQYESPIQMSRHRGREHGYDPMAEALAQLQEPTPPVTVPVRRRRTTTK